MRKHFCYVRFALLIGFLCIAVLAQADITLSAKESSLGDIVPGIIGQTMIVSADGRHAAYAVLHDGKLSVVVDGKSGSTYDDIGADLLVFSPDSQRVAYGAKQGDKWVMVVDGKPGPAYDAIGASGPVFSPDSRHVAYEVKHGDNWCAVVDGETCPDYTVFLKGSRLIFDSPTSLHTLALRDTTVFRVKLTITQNP